MQTRASVWTARGCFLDWEEASTSPGALDYGYPLITVFVSEADLTFDELSASAFYGSYAGSGGVISQRHVFDAAVFHAFGTCGGATGSAGNGSCVR